MPSSSFASLAHQFGGPAGGPDDLDVDFVDAIHLLRDELGAVNNLSASGTSWAR